MSLAYPTRERLKRLVEFAGVGAVGMGVDLAITFTLLGALSPLAANVCGFAVAVTHNFAGNWMVTFDRPAGDLRRQYASYVGFHTLTFGVRALVLSSVLAATALPATVATVLGVGVATVVNYLATERIFDGDGSLWFDFAEGLNHLAHTIYNSRLRGLLMAAGLYDPLFSLYAWVLAAVTPASTKKIRVAGVCGSVCIEAPTETVSVLHTLENEGDVLRQFVRDIRPGDRVLDVGANLGVYTSLATAAGAAVDAVEPHPPTAARCRENCPEATVHEMALGSGVGTVGLDVPRDAVGAQRGGVDADGESVRQLPGDRLPPADVVKIDVEGAELAVLDGLQRQFERSPPRVVYVETHGDGQCEAVRERLSAVAKSVTKEPVGDCETMLRVETKPPEGNA